MYLFHHEVLFDTSEEPSIRLDISMRNLISIPFSVSCMPCIPLLLVSEPVSSGRPEEVGKQAQSIRSLQRERYLETQDARV